VGFIYPESGPNTALFHSIVGRAGHFKEVPREAVHAAVADIDAACAVLAGKAKDVGKMVNDRAGLRQDILHYEEKLPKLEATAGANPKEATKLAENKAKLEEVKGKFADLDAATEPELAKLDAFVAETFDKAFRGFYEALAKALRAQAESIDAALGGAPAPAAPAEGAAPAHDAAAAAPAPTA